MSTRWVFSLGRDPIHRKMFSLRLILILAAFLLVGLSLMAMRPRQEARQGSIPATPSCNTYISTGIITDTTWTLSGSPYCLKAEILVNTGVTLTIEPGVFVYPQFTYSGIGVNGTLNAVGTLAQPITFTSFNLAPAPGDWLAIRIFGVGSAHLEYCDISYAGNGYGAGIQDMSSNFEMRHCQIHHNLVNGLFFFGNNGASAIVADSQFDHNTGAGILESPGASGVYDRGPTYTNITFSANDTDALVLSEGTLNYTCTLDGSDFNGSPIILADHALHVISGHTLTINPGTTIQFTKPYGELNIDGGLVANGTPSQWVTFTTNAASPAPGSWRRIIVTASGLIQLSYCNLGYTSEGLRLETPKVQVNQCRIHHSAGDGIYVFGVQVRIANAAITDNGRGVVSNNGGLLNGIYLTLARNGIGAFLDGSATVNLTNTILADNTIGVHVEGGGAATFIRTLWDGNTTPVEGTINESGHIDGPAGFAADGYHITLASAAIHAGISNEPMVDIDGENRPQPPNSAPDLGCDEIYSPYQQFLALVVKQ